MTFAEQAEIYLIRVATRKKSPVRSTTIRTYRNALNQVNPLIGHLNLEVIENGIVKSVGDALVKTYGPATVTLYVNVIKEVMKSAIDQNGNYLYPRTWNNDFLDLPAIENQKQATITPESLQDALGKANDRELVLLVLLAGTGLRVSEALALHAGPDDGVHTWWDRDLATIIVRDQRNGDSYSPPKTKAGLRTVDLAPALQKFLLDKIPATTVSYIVFPGDKRTYAHRLDFVPGFHSLRRFRETWLEKNNAPRMLMKFWTGHAAADISERYIKFGKEVETRKTEVARIGLGFTLEGL